MKIDLKKKENELDGVINVNVTPEDYEKEFDQLISSYKREMNMPGFRPGKTPKTFVMKMFGDQAKQKAVLQSLQNKLDEFIKNEKLDLILEPLPTDEKDIDWKQENEFEFTFSIGLRPKVEVDESKLGTFEKYKPEIEAKDIEKEIDTIVRQYGNSEPRESIEKAENILVYLELRELDDSEKVLEGGVKATASMSLSDYSDNIHKQLIGKKKEETFTIDLSELDTDKLSELLKVDKPTANDLNKKFSAKLSYILEYEPVTLDESLFKQYFGNDEVKTEAEFRDKIKEQLEHQYSGYAGRLLFKEIKESLMQSHDIQLPEDFLRKYFEQSVAEKEKEGESMDDKTKEKEFNKFLNDIRWQIMVAKFSDKFDVKAEEEEIKTMAQQIVFQRIQMGYLPFEQDKFQTYINDILSDQRELAHISGMIKENKVLENLSKQAKVDEKSIHKDELVKKFETTNNL